MLVWFRKLTDMFREEEIDPRSVRSILKTAVERGAGVGFCDPEVEGCATPNQGSIEALEGDAVVIQLPASGVTAPEIGARVLISIDAKPGFEVGETRILSTWQRSDGEIRRAGIRVSIPPMLEHVQRRERHRLPVAFDLSPRAQIALIAGETETPIGSADILDICESGARLRIKLPESVAQTFAPEQVIRIDAIFPDPFPSFCCSGDIVHMKFGGEFVGHIVGIRFHDPRPEIGRAIHECEMRRARRNRR